jgi:hypothetical protein
MRAILAVSIIGLTAAALPAQIANFLGFAGGFDTSFTDRGNANAIDSDILQVFRTRDYRHWMIDPANPLATSSRIVGMRIIIQDQIGTTPETYTLVGYRDDPLNPGSPNIDPTGAGIWFRTGLLTTPPSAATGAAFWTITFGINPPAIPHLATPDTQDNVYLGIGLNSGTWATDGLGVWMAFDMSPSNASTNSRDVVGPRVVNETNNFVVTVPTTGGASPLPTGGLANYPNPATIGSYRQLNLEILAQATGGVSVTQTNQLRYPSSLPHALFATAVPLGGTTNMLSGLNPDVNNASAALPPPAGSPARADDVGFVVTERNRPGSLVVVSCAFAPLSGGTNPDGSLPVVFIPGFNAPTSTGVLCADIFGPVFTFFGVSDANGRFQQMFGLTPAARTVLMNLGAVDFIWQGFVVNLAINPAEVKATGCVTQHL